MNKPQKVLEKEITVEEFLNFVNKHLDCIVEYRSPNFRILNGDDPAVHIKLRKASGKVSEAVIHTKSQNKISPTMIVSLMHGKIEIAQSVFLYENNFKVVYTERETEINGQTYYSYMFDVYDKPKNELVAALICQVAMEHAMDDHRETEVTPIQ